MIYFCYRKTIIRVLINILNIKHIEVCWCLLTVTVNQYLLWYKFFINDLVICHLQTMHEYENILWEKISLDYKFYLNNGLN